MKVLRSFESISFSVPGPAMAMPRARHTKTGHSYTPKPAVDHKAAIQWAWNQADVSRERSRPIQIDAIVELEITVCRVLPKSAPKWMRQAVDFAEAYDLALAKVPCPTKPDWDNYGKIVSDALNGLAYRDDGQVFRGTVTKIYAGTAETRITVTYWRWEDEG